MRRDVPEICVWCRSVSPRQSAYLASRLGASQTLELRGAHPLSGFLPRAQACCPAQGFLAFWNTSTCLSCRQPKLSDLRCMVVGGRELSRVKAFLSFQVTTELMVMQVTPTDTMIIRGRFQTLPLAIYGWTLPTAPGQVFCCGADLLFRIHDSLTEAKASSCLLAALLKHGEFTLTLPGHCMRPCSHAGAFSHGNVAVCCQTLTFRYHALLSLLLSPLSCLEAALVFSAPCTWHAEACFSSDSGVYSAHRLAAAPVHRS